MNDSVTILVVVVAFGVGYFVVSKLINFNRDIKANKPTVSGGGSASEKEYLWNVCLLAKGLAMVDGPVNSHELMVISDYISRNTTSDEALNVMLTRLVNDPVPPPMSVERHAEQCQRLREGRTAELSALFAFLENVAAADAPFNEAEQKVLKSIRAILK